MSSSFKRLAFVSGFAIAPALLMLAGCGQSAAKPLAGRRAAALDSREEAKAARVDNSERPQANSDASRSDDAGPPAAATPATLPLALADPSDPKKDDGPADEGTLDILRQIKKLQNFDPPPDLPGDQVKSQFQKNMREIIALSDKLLAAKPNDDRRSMALEFKAGAMGGLEESGDESNSENYRKFLESLTKEKDPDFALYARAKLLSLRLSALSRGKAEDPDALLIDVKKFVDDGSLDRRHFLMLKNALEDFRKGEKFAQAKELSELMGKFTTSRDPEIAGMAAEIKKSADIQLGMVGKPVAFKGTLLDGSPFQLSDYKGKVVLIDFWATWCGPCVAEVPNVKKNYEAYHDKGFEVIGISLDTEKADVEEFVKSSHIPWHTIFDADPANTKGFDSKLPTQFGINSIPAVFLVDRDGKMVSISARGERLGKNLEKMLGKPAE